MKIIFAADGIFPHAVGGMQRHSRLLIESLANYDEIELIVVHPHEGQKLFEGFKNVIECPVASRPLKRQYILECYDLSKRILDIVMRFEDAVVYSQGLAVWANIESIGYRVIINPHGLESYQSIGLRNKLIGLPFKYIFDYLFKHSRYIVSLGGKLTGILQYRVPNNKEKIVVIPNGTRINGTAGVEKNFEYPLKCVFVGRFAYNKGIDILMEAADTLHTRAEGIFEFHLVGKGPLYEKYIQGNTPPNVTFHGFLEDDELENLYREGDLFVLPTLFEGMPTVILEAMKYGMPVVVTDVGATTELVDSENGYIIEKNDPAGLVKTLIDFSELPVEQKQALSVNSFAKVKSRFTWEKIAARHIELFKNLHNEMHEEY